MLFLLIIWVLSRASDYDSFKSKTLQYILMVKEKVLENVVLHIVALMYHNMKKLMSRGINKHDL